MASKMSAREEVLAQMSMDFTDAVVPTDLGGSMRRFRRRMPVAKDASSLSNLIELWESVPKYCMEAHKQAALRSPEGLLKSVTRTFEHKGHQYTMHLHPARVQVEGTDDFVEYFPTPADQVVEHLLIKLLAAENGGAMQGTRDVFGCMVRFRYSELFELLEAAGCERNYSQIKHSLEVLAGVRLTIKTDRKNSHSEAILASLTLPDSYNGYCVARFHTLIAGAILANEYRQFPLDLWLSLRSGTARWALVQMCQTTNLGPERPFETTVSEAEAAGVTSAARFHDRLKAMHRAVEELQRHGVVEPGDGVRVEPVKDPRTNKRIDCRFQLVPTRRITDHVIVANLQAKRLREEGGATVPSNPGLVSTGNAAATPRRVALPR